VKIGPGTGVGSVHALPASLVTVKEELKIGAWTPRDQALAPYRSPDDDDRRSDLALHGSNPAAPAPSDGRSGWLGRNAAKGQHSLESKQQRRAGPDQCCRHVIAPAKMRARVVP
jgi:hypothetical protein